MAVSGLFIWSIAIPFSGRILMLPLLAMTLSGCAAAILPIAAAGVLGSKQVSKEKQTESAAPKDAVAAPVLDRTNAAAPERAAVQTASPQIPALVPGRGNPGDKTAAAATVDHVIYVGQGGAGDELDRIFNVGSAKDRHIVKQYDDFAAFAVAQAETESAAGSAGPGKSVILVPRPDINKPEFTRCNAREKAVIIDLDRRIGDQNIRPSLASASAQPGIAESVRKIRAAGLKIIWISDASDESTDAVVKMLRRTDLSRASDNDFLSLNRGRRDRKQLRRREAADRFCIVAMLGDDRSDFDELYQYLRRQDSALALGPMIGRGWFLASSPLISPLP